MTHYYLDASALVKRYVPEIGTPWTVSLTNPQLGHTVLVAEITRVEIASALAAKHRAPLGITRRTRDQAVALMLRHFNTEYQIIPLTASIIRLAVTLTQNHRLRGYDAVQLAAALTANSTLLANSLGSLTCISADTDLLTAARAEGLPVDNPNLHP